MTRLGFIGAGNMGEAILRGILREGLLAPHNVYAYDPNQKRSKPCRPSWHTDGTERARHDRALRYRIVGREAKRVRIRSARMCKCAQRQGADFHRDGWSRAILRR